MPKNLTLATAQVHTLSSLSATLDALRSTTERAAAQGADIILFPEAYLGGYPRTCSFGAAVGGRSDEGREQFMHYFQSAVDLGDTPAGAGEDWLHKRLPGPRDGGINGKGVRGDGTREVLENVARKTGVFVVAGVVERSGGSLYCSVVYVCPREGCLGKRRKVMPTGSERLVWAQGSPSTLKAISTTIKGVKVTMASVICWENYMPLTRFAVYAQNVNLYLAPTADGRDTWLSLMRTVGCESRAFVMSANQCLQQKDLPGWITGKKSAQEHTSSTTNGGTSVPYRRLRRQSIVTKTADNHEITWPLPDTANAVSLEQHVNGDGHPPARRPSIAAKTFENHDVVISSPLAKSKPAHVQPEPQTSSTSTIREESSSNDNDFVSRGGSCVIGPMGQVIVAPVWEKTDELLMATVDFEDCERGRLDFDAAGSYSRSDAFKLTVEGLDLTPPC